jgi:hypothetical protein
MAKISGSFLIWFLIFSLILTFSCSKDRNRLAGRYVAEDNKGKQLQTVLLELKSNGEGSWATEEDNISFRWEIKGEEILVHTKSGGVIIGNIVGETIKINLPGVSMHSFKKAL